MGALFELAAARSAEDSSRQFFVPIGVHSGVPQAAAGLLLSVAGFLAIFVRLVAGAAADRRPRANPYVVAAMMLTGTAGLVLVAIGTALTFVIGALLTVAGGWAGRV